MRQWDRTHAALREAAFTMFAERGYDATPTAAVAARAGVSEMTLFRHFASKEALLLEDPYDPVMADAVRHRPSGEPPMRALAEGVRDAWARVTEADVEALHRLLRIVAATPALAGALERNSAATALALGDALIDRGVGTGAARAAAAALIAGVSRALLDWSEDESVDLHVRLGEALDVLGGC